MTRIARLLCIALFFSACGPTLSVKIDPEAKLLPTPVFSIEHLDRQEENPSYSQIRVFEDDGVCAVPKCSIVWHVDVSVDSSPKRLTYGKLPSIGSISVVPPRKLEVGKSYILVLDYGPSVPPTDKGKLKFRIDENAEAIPLE